MVVATRWQEDKKGAISLDSANAGSSMVDSPFEEKTSQSGQEEEKSNIFPQDMSIKSCGRLDFSRIHWCNMALWRALALLSMMVPAVAGLLDWQRNRSKFKVQLA